MGEGMNKPNGISDKVWERSRGIAEMFSVPQREYACAKDIAIAISKAIEEEREECALVSEGHRERDLGEASNDYAAGHFVASGRIAKAIRSRSKGEE